MKSEFRAKIQGSTKDVFWTYGAEILENPLYQRTALLRQHRTTTTYAHCIAVTMKALNIAKKLHLKVDASSLVRGCLLHDYYLYEYTTMKPRPKKHASHHGETAMNNAIEDFGLNEIEKNMIFCHMWPLRFWNFPKSREAFLLSLSDKMVALKEASRSKKKGKKK